MSWPLASFLIVAGVLGVGWLAYERRRPSARMAAVVAVMAALAALGRDAFAALPDVKPITAMTLVVGYALGPLPGFTVGALGMLVSNFLLGQGPYTPWQMAAWGMVGLAGAALGALTGRRLGRVPLALACAVAALAAKEVMNIYTWTLGATHTPAALLAVAGQALAYDITDTVASFLFGLAFAPELASVLGRMRLRMHVSWDEGIQPPSPPARRARRRASRTLVGVAGAGLAAGAGVVLLLAGGSPGGQRPGRGGLAVAQAATARAPTGPGVAGAAGIAALSGRALSREVAFLVRAQNRDGGYGGAPGQTSTELYSAWAAIGLAAAGRDPVRVRRDGHSVLDALRSQAATLQGAGDLERTILALRACGVSSRSFSGGDLVARLLRARSGDGSFGGLSNLTAFAILALRAAGYPRHSPVIASAAAWLARQQDRDGGFSFAVAGGASDVDDTAAVLQALAAAGRPGGAARGRAVTYVLDAENPDGGFPQQPRQTSNAQSTAWAIQGLTAAGRDAAAVSRGGSRSPVAYLLTLLTPSGSVRYSPTGAQTPVWVTAQALTALAAKPLPVAPTRG